MQSWPRLGIKVGLSVFPLLPHTHQEEMDSPWHFLSVPYSGKINFQDAEQPRTLKLAKESMRVGVLPGKDRGRTE